MAINLNGLSTGQTGSAKSRESDSSQATNKAGTERAADKKDNSKNTDDVVKLSDRAEVLRTVNNKVQQLPDVDQEKVDSIRTAIQNGDYTIDYNKLAAAFRRFESGL
jgi:negative regulator of flagellin synthesis FlgM